MRKAVEAASEAMRSYLLKMAATPEWAGWLRAAQVLSAHSGANLRKTDDSYRQESKIALWGTIEQWALLSYTVKPSAIPRLVPVDASASDTACELVYGEQEVMASDQAAALRAPQGSKHPARTNAGRLGMDPSEATANLEFLLQVEGWKVYRRPDERGAEAYCKFVSKEIWVQRSGDLWTDFHRLAHEVGHALIHQPENNKPAVEKPSMWAGEIEAEAVAMLLGDLLGADIAWEAARYILCRSTGHPSEWIDFRVETLAFSDRVKNVVVAAVETIQDLSVAALAEARFESHVEYESV
jgi:hypothetical protein